MNLQNGYKVIYEKAADGKRVFYASKSAVYPNEDDLVVASFDDAEYKGKVIYEYKGEFYASVGNIPSYDENGEPADTKLEGFNKVFVEGYSEEPAAASYSRRARKPAPVVEEPATEEPVVENEPEAEPVEE